jgi:hypothetical protein
MEVKTITELENPHRKNIHLQITYQGQPVQDLDYSYWLGDGYSALVTARDGMGIAMLEGEAARQFTYLRFRIEYQYDNKAHLEPEVKAMMENVIVPYFSRAEKRVELAPLIAPVTRPAPLALQPVLSAPGTESASPEALRNTLTSVVNAIRSGNHQSVRQQFTPEGYQMYEKLIASGRVTVLDPQLDTLRFLRIGNETMVRSVPMLFSYHNNRNRFVENVVFDFNQDNKISGLSFSLGSVAINDILSKPQGFGSDEERFQLIRFMENYKTAFALKRIDYLEAIFDENALIIVGNIVQRSAEPVENVANMYGNLSRQEVEYIRLSKSEYMERLRRNFSRNEFINIHFEDNQVRKTQRDDKIYGIQIAQHYHSSTYADKGYLFLMIDLNDTLNPRIYVRTWQPEKNPDGSIFGLEDFRF